MFTLLTTLAWSQTAACDTATLSKVIIESVGDQVTESFISLAACAPALTHELQGRLGRPLSEDLEFWRAAPEAALQWSAEECEPFSLLTGVSLCRLMKPLIRSGTNTPKQYAHNCFLFRLPGRTHE